MSNPSVVPAAQPREPRHSLWEAVARSVRDNVIAEFVVQGVRVGGFVVLARALTPEDFGVFRILLVVSVFATLSNDAGITDALVQRKELTAAHEATAWWLGMVAATCSILALYAAAPAIAAAMGTPNLTGGERLLCLPILLDATTMVSASRLRRALNFTALAIADIVAEIGFIAVALLVLWRGMPAWALPAGLAARFAAHAIAIWIAKPGFPRGMPRRQAAHDFANFSLAAWGGRIIYVLSSNADYLLVGRLLGSSALGFYSMAWDVLRFVPDRLHRVAGRVTFPAFCILQNDGETLSRAYLDFFDYMARVVLPLAACAAIAAPEILGTIYGPQWVPAALPMRLLAPGLALSGLRLGIGSVFYSKNRPAIDMYLHGVRLGFLVAAVVGLARFELLGVSAGMSVVEGVVSVLGQALACALLGLRLRKLAWSVMPALKLTVLCALATIGGRTLAILASSGRPTTLLAAALPPALVYLWMERSNAMDLFGKAFVPSAGARPKASEAQA